jgi:hypothetical protein
MRRYAITACTRLKIIDPGSNGLVSTLPRSSGRTRSWRKATRPSAATQNCYREDPLFDVNRRQSCHSAFGQLPAFPLCAHIGHSIQCLVTDVFTD